MSGTVDVTRGGGELGRGFYTGEHLHEAKAWSFHVTRDKQQNVVEFDSPDALVEGLEIAFLEHGTASLRRSTIKRAGATRTHLFGVDLVWSPIVGTERASGDQYKWESDVAQTLLNGPATSRQVL